MDKVGWHDVFLPVLNEVLSGIALVVFALNQEPMWLAASAVIGIRSDLKQRDNENRVRLEKEQG